MDIVTADRISDRIVDFLTAELAIMKREGTVDGTVLLAGQLLAFKALKMTMPEPLPDELSRLDAAVDEVLKVLL